MASPAGPVRLERRGPVARLILDRPPLNVLDFEMISAIDAAVAEVEADRKARVLVVASSGEKAFSAGVDVKIHTPDLIPRMLREFHGCLTRLTRCPAVTIAAVRGAALGGGFELALVSDLIVATEESRLGLPEIRLGCFPPVALALLPRRIGHSRAAELLLTGEPFSAGEAAAMGLVNRVVKPGELESTVASLIEKLIAMSPSVQRLLLRELRRRSQPDLEADLAEVERCYVEELVPLPDCAEGVRAFVEKREPRWLEP